MVTVEHMVTVFLKAATADTDIAPTEGDRKVLDVID